MTKNILIPFICGAGASTAGAEQGPVVLQERGLTAALRAQGLSVEWGYDPAQLYREPDGAVAHAALPALGDPQRRALVLRHCRTLCDRVAATIAAGARPVTIGGDHAMGAGSVAGAARALRAHGRIGLLWIDAHADINTPQTTPSHALHGMPVSALLGIGDPDFAALAGGPAAVRPEHIFYLGLRDVDAGEQEILENLGVRYMTAADVARVGYDAALAEAIAHITTGTDHLFLSLDIDAFDPEYAPATGTPVAGGLDAPAFIPALARAIAAHHFAAFEITEFNPTLPGVDRTYDLVREALGAILAAATRREAA